MKKAKKKKVKTKMTKKMLLIYIIITVVGGTCSYLLGAGVTKAILDAEAAEKREEQKEKAKEGEEVNIEGLTQVETIEEETLEKVIKSYNKKMEDATYKINMDELEEKENGKEITKNDVTFFFQTEDDNLKITVIKYEEENDTIKDIIQKMIQANNSELKEDIAKRIYENVVKTKEETKEDGISTSQFFQFHGLESSLKTYEKESPKYQFRIGRLTKKNTD